MTKDELSNLNNAKHLLKGSRAKLQKYVIGVYGVMAQPNPVINAAVVREHLNSISRLMAKADEILDRIDSSYTGFTTEAMLKDEEA
tara:strand:- start:1042 stop:1299 length:258 start_codon:yes stop_codon:yes gene_type:complete